MKLSGNKICIGISAIVITLMLIISGMNARYMQNNSIQGIDAINSKVISAEECIQTNSTVGLIIGMEITQSL